MEHQHISGFVIALLLVPAAVFSQAVTVDSAITEVTVYADRAQVTREAPVELRGDAGAYAFAALPGWVDEGSLRVALVPADAGQILDVEPRRTFLARASDEEVLRAQAAVDEVGDQLAALADELAVIEAEAGYVDGIRAFSLEKLPRDVALREVQPSEYTAAVDFLGASLRRLGEKRREVERRQRELQPELQVRRKRLLLIQQRAQLEQRTVVVTTQGAAARHATLKLTYYLPGATWLPVHEVRTTNGDPRLALTSHAEVMQTSGEDWTGAKLTLSTQRSTETLRIPEVEALLLGGDRSTVRFMSSPGDTFAAATKSYDELNRAYFAAQNAEVDLEDYRDNQARQVTNAQRVAEVFQTLEQRGTTAHFSAIGRQTVRSDGRRVRVPIGKLELDAVHRTLAVPELTRNAVRTVELTNTGGQPLLPGKVSLFVDGAFLGMTEVGFVAPGEGFSLFLGVADTLKVSRVLDRKSSELKRRGTRTRMDVSFVVRVENLSNRRQRLELRDRVPVSQIEAIRVLEVKVTPSGAPNAKGLLSWDLDLGPREVREFRIGYGVEYPTELVRRSFDEIMDVEGGEEARRLQQELQSLEKNF